MSSDIRRILLDVSSQVFEMSAFMAVFPPEMVDSDKEFPSIAASIDFSGPMKGRLILAVSPDIMPPLVTSMLGLDEDDTVSDASKRDALLEVLNMMCGNVLTGIHGVKPVFNLRPPVLISSEEAQEALSTVPPESHVTVSVENTRADIILQLEDS